MPLPPFPQSTHTQSPEQPRVSLIISRPPYAVMKPNHMKPSVGALMSSPRLPVLPASLYVRYLSEGDSSPQTFTCPLALEYLPLRPRWGEA